MELERRAVEGLGGWVVTAEGYRVSFGVDKVVLKLVIFAPLKSIELYTLNGQNVWYINLCMVCLKLLLSYNNRPNKQYLQEVCDPDINHTGDM